MTPLVKKPDLDKAAAQGASWLRSKYADWILAAISFAESVFAPILIDRFLVALIFARRHRWVRYVLVAIGASVVGGLAAYALGALFYDTIGEKIVAMFGLSDDFERIAANFNSTGFVFVLIGAVTPIPYKVVAIASGLLHINLVTFIIASIIGRTIRLGLVGYAAYVVGPKALPVIQRHLHLTAALVGILLVAYVIYKFV